MGEPGELDWRIALRADWEDRIDATPPEKREQARAEMAWELEHADELSHYTDRDGHDVTLREMWEQEAESLRARGLPPQPAQPSPAFLDGMQRSHVRWLDEQIRDERTSPEWRFRFLHVRGALTQRAGDLVGALLARAWQVGRSTRPREQRPRRSGPSSRDGPSDEPPDDLDDRARRGWSS